MVCMIGIPSVKVKMMKTEVVPQMARFGAYFEKFWELILPKCGMAFKIGLAI